MLPVTIIISSLILGSFFYASQVNKQKSIERQQEIKLQDDRIVEKVRPYKNTKKAFSVVSVLPEIKEYLKQIEQAKIRLKSTTKVSTFF